jgi:translation initiation factor 3 subunit F
MATQLFLGDATNTSCHIHPVVIMSILDHYTRKSKNGERVIGTLLGLVSAEGIVEIRSSFPVPHSEGEEVCRTHAR